MDELMYWLPVFPTAVVVGLLIRRFFPVEADEPWFIRGVVCLVLGGFWFVILPVLVFVGVVYYPVKFLSWLATPRTECKKEI